MSSASPRLRVAIAIPTYRREQVLVDTVAQVLRLSPSPDEVLVIDQTEAHDEATRRALAEHQRQGRIRLIAQPQANLPAARNRAIRETRCEILIFIDDDVELEPDFIARHMRNYADDEVAAVAGRIIQERPFAVTPRKPGVSSRRDFRHLDLAGTAPATRVGRVGGCNHSARTAALKAIGGYDESFIASAMFEDTDLAIRLLDSGRRIDFDPAAYLHHLQTPSGGCRLDEWSRVLGLWTSAFPELYFQRKHFFASPSYIAYVGWRCVRKYVLRRDHLVRPWLLPLAAAAYAYAWIRSLLTRARPL